MTDSPQAPIEPVLELDDIQGIAAPGFFKPHQALLYLWLSPKAEHYRLQRSALRSLLTYGVISDGRSTLEDRRNHRKHMRGLLPKPQRPPLGALTFTSQGLSKLSPAYIEIESPAFQGGLAARSALLGDSTEKGKPGHPDGWVVGKPNDELDAMVILAGDHHEPVRDSADRIKTILEHAHIRVETQYGDVRSDDPGHEHFGFDDGVSQPGIRGRASAAVNDFVTERYLSLTDGDDALRFGYPGQDLVWPGEFILGYQASSPDPVLPGPVAGCAPWMKNSSFLVYRRLQQDVAGFWKTMTAQAEKLRKDPAFKDWDAVRLASMLVGRWPSGAPVMRTSSEDEKLGADLLAHNDFRFDNASPKRTGRLATPYTPAPADPVGLICPASAHIRKVNVRDCPSDMGGRIATLDRRLLRVGVAYGKSLKPPYNEDPEKGDRGLLFLSIQSSIEDQFEFLQARWINNPSRPRGPGGHDMIVGQNTVAEGQVRKCPIFGKGEKQARVTADIQFVTATGGGYFFVPSITALRTVVLAEAGA